MKNQIKEETVFVLKNFSKNYYVYIIEGNNLTEILKVIDTNIW